ncbi:hypothetical protein V8C42DRAFT_335592 [Trichoderma barbatum]
MTPHPSLFYPGKLSLSSWAVYAGVTPWLMLASMYACMYLAHQRLSIFVPLTMHWIYEYLFSLGKSKLSPWAFHVKANI